MKNFYGGHTNIFKHKNKSRIKFFGLLGARLSAASLALVVLFGCATAPVPVSAARQVNADNFLEGYATLAAPAAGASQVTFVRDSGMLGAGAAARLSVNGVDVAKLRTRDRLDIYLKPGTYVIGVVPSPKIAGALVEESVNIQVGKHHYYRISVTTGGFFAVQASAQLDK